MRPGRHRRAQVHHVAVVAERRGEGPVEVGAADEPVDRVPAAGEPGEPARHQDGEPAVAVDVAGLADLLGGDREDPVVERLHQVAEHLGADGRGVSGVDVHLDPMPDRPQQPADRQVIAGAGDVAVAGHHVERPGLRRQRPDRFGDGRERPAGQWPGRSPGRRGLGSASRPDRGGVERPGPDPDRVRPLPPRQGRDDDQRPRPGPRRGDGEPGVPLPLAAIDTLPSAGLPHRLAARSTRAPEPTAERPGRRPAQHARPGRSGRPGRSRRRSSGRRRRGHSRQPGGRGAGPIRHPPSGPFPTEAGVRLSIGPAGRPA